MPTVTHVELNKAAQKFRKELLIMAVIGLARSLEHMTLRTGVRYKETVGELNGPVELMPYTGLLEDADDNIGIDGRDLETGHHADAGRAGYVGSRALVWEVEEGDI